MAILNKRWTELDEQAIKLLCAGSLEILAPIDHFAGRAYHILDVKRNLVRIEADYAGVEFKFECFFMRASIAHRRTEPARSLMSVASIDCDSIACLDRSEWTRATMSGEVPADYEPVVQRRGRISERPTDFLSSCLSTVGLLCVSGGVRVGLLALNNSDPLSLSFTKDFDAIEAFVAECDPGKEITLQK